MAIINATLSASVQGHILPVNAGNDITTFCSVDATLSATLLDTSRPSDTFLWEQVLEYTYVRIDRPNKQIYVTGDITSTFVSPRELISIFYDFSTTITLTVISYAFDGVNTVLTMLDPIDASVPASGVFEHAGPATDGSFTWSTPANVLSAVITILTNNNKKFRFWSNRGKRWQRYDDVMLILTPQDTLYSGQSTLPQSQIAASADCRSPSIIAYPTVPYDVGLCTGGTGQQITSGMSARVNYQTCDYGFYPRYVIQQSCDGGSTWTTLSVSSTAQEVPVTTGCGVRVLALYQNVGSAPLGLSQVFNSIDALDIGVSNVACTDFPPGMWMSGFDTVCSAGMNATPLAANILSYQVTGVILINASTNPETAADQTNLNINTLPTAYNITGYQATEVLVISYNTNPEILDQTPTALNTLPTGYNITSYATSGSVTIGG